MFYTGAAVCVNTRCVNTCSPPHLILSKQHEPSLSLGQEQQYYDSLPQTLVNF